ncbi:hypothetical protein K491DRAFT_238674 [Lophiostoma macrostomum CBS 122681]|uniref:Uncharacterized protein n=1 Tax=Lophiostoma macrostomum CBS 122681 TaxID=1314788 RepID=A0A6A6SNW7_9PLEO|nr:hypothetical protein K491DRAFT_238674 [Lophiostoma macrostomum CBS 122681]
MESQSSIFQNSESTALADGASMTTSKGTLGDHSSMPSPEPAPDQNTGHTPLLEAEQVEETHNDNHTREHSNQPGDDKKSIAPSLSSIKSYNHRDSRKFLLWTGFNRLCVTLLLCLILALTLRAYEGFDEKHPRILGKGETKTFNALVLGLSLALGLNLASSLKHYGLILRWTILTRRYVTLQVFDLILGCENLTNVLKLMIVSIPGIERVAFDKVPLLKDIAWLKARRDGSRYTWVICLLWILINIGAQTLVATLSIFWPVNPSEIMPLLVRGDISVSDLRAWQVDASNHSTAPQLSVANAYGIAGSQYPTYSDQSAIDELYMQGSNAVLRGDDYYQYTFLNRNPDSMHSDYIASSRGVRSSAACTQFTFGEGSGDRLNGSVYASSDGGHSWDYYPILHSIKGQITWTAIVDETCGDRCTTLYVYQRADNYTIVHNSMFLCNSTVSDITGKDDEFTGLKDEKKASIYSADKFAQIAAGAIGWSGYYEDGFYDRQSKAYLSGLPFTPYEILNTTGVQDIISRFTIGAIAAFDDHGPRIILKDQQGSPLQGQQLQVDWLRVLIILMWICLLQSLALVVLLACANKSIMRDESFFSLAMLLSPIVNRIGRESGMNLSGEEIYNHPKLWNQKIKYHYRKIKDGSRKIKKVDILVEDEDWSEKDMLKRSHPWGDGLFC